MIDFKNYPRFEDYKWQNILAVDYGLKIVGLSTFCPGSDPFPLMHGRLRYDSDMKLIADLKTIIKQEDIEIMVLGVPYYTDGSESEMTKTVQAFSEKFKKSGPGIVVFEQDEVLTTEKAKEIMEGSPEYNFKVDLKKIDMLSATIILQDFICHVD